MAGCGEGASQAAGPGGEAGPGQIDHIVLDAEDAAELQALINRSSTVQRVRVVDIREEDSRPACGSLVRIYDLEILSSSGDRHEVVYATLDSGGNVPAHIAAQWIDPAVVAAELDRDFLRQGETYWMLLGPTTQADNQPARGMLAWWPERATPAMIPELVDNDAFHWRPMYDRATEVSYGYTIESPEQWKLIVKQGGELLWEQTVTNDPALGNDDPGLRVYGVFHDMDPVDAPDTGEPMLLYSMSRVTLRADNRFGVPADGYRIRTARELHTGKLLAEWVLSSERYNEYALRQYDRDTGGLMLSARYESLDTGGIAAGGDADAWLRKTVVRYDSDGHVISTEVFRHGSVVDENGLHLHNGWVAVGGE
ncbi:hypothetical protein OT109_00960 [Phycisphaeraceae bacterium D3-23]